MQSLTCQKSLSIGDFEPLLLQGGLFHLDGGTMFAHTPKILWQKQYTLDKDNLIPVCNDPLLIRTGEKSIIVNTGRGNKLEEKLQKSIRSPCPVIFPINKPDVHEKFTK